MKNQHQSNKYLPTVDVTLFVSGARKDFEIFGLNRSAEEGPAAVTHLAAVGVVLASYSAAYLNILNNSVFFQIGL